MTARLRLPGGASLALAVVCVVLSGCETPAYRNPIIFADYSDPDAVRVGDDFYMTASSFTAVPGCRFCTPAIS